MFIDDILINFETAELHRKHLHAVLRTLRESQLYAKFSKCEFWLDSVKFLGHVVWGDGVNVVPDKVEAVLN